MLGVEDVTIKEISVSTVPQVVLSLIQLAMGGLYMLVCVCVCVCVCALSALHAPLSMEQTDGSLLWPMLSESGF